MKRLIRLAVPLVIALAVASVLVYLFRFPIMRVMYDLLQSLDDTGAEEVAGDADHTLPSGGWQFARDRGIPADTAGSEEDDRLEQIRSLGYLSGYEEAPIQRNVTIHDSTRTTAGYNMLISGHAPGISLIDMEGNIVHEWYLDIDVSDLCSDAEYQGANWITWRRGHLFENGDLLIVIRSEGEIRNGKVVKIDCDSNLLWATDWFDAHHDIDVDDDGNIYVLGRTIQMNERFSNEFIVTEDYLQILDSLGNTLDKISIPDLIMESPFAPTMRRSDSYIAADQRGDITHCNAITFIREGQLPDDYNGPFREGTVLLSMRNTGLICAVDLDDRSIYWGESDFWHMQHEPILLPNGNMLIFDNQGAVDASAVIEFDQEIKEIEWIYRGDDDNPFYSFIIGSCQRLPDGNTLITESTFGRAFEVTPEKEIVWEYYSPYRAGKNLELIATLFEVLRVSEEYTASWLVSE